MCGTYKKKIGSVCQPEDFAVETTGISHILRKVKFILINILVTLNEGYLSALKVMLKSLFETNSEDTFSIYLIYADISDNKLSDLRSFVADEGHVLTPIHIEPELFTQAPVLRHYTREMYFRLLAHKVLPDSLERILYLDPDIVAINPISEFYHTDFDGHCFVAAEHEITGKILRIFNNLRLGTLRAKGYYNTGVLLMNLTQLRKEGRADELLSFIKRKKRRLFLPDQDILNVLYWDSIKSVDSFHYNYDPRRFELLHKGRKALEKIRRNTVFIHYCGGKKPWNKEYKRTLGCFYRKYAQMLSYDLCEGT